jgi:hypothetical protein
MDFAEKAEEHIRELKQLLEAAEQRNSEQMAQRAEEKRIYEEEIVRVREEGKRRVEEVGKMADEIAQRVKEETSRRAEERRGYVEEVKRVREEGNQRVERVANMAQEINRHVKEEATRRAEELEKVKNERNRREEEIFKRAEDATQKAQEAIAAALAGKVEAERHSANLMEEAEEKIRKAVEDAVTRMDRQKENHRTERQHRIIRNLEEMPDSDADVEAIQNIVRIPIAGPSNRGIREPLGGMNQRVGQKVTFFQL